MLKNIKTDMIEDLIKISMLSTCHYKHSAAVIKNGKILSMGINKFYNNISIHAEVDAVINYMKLYKKNNIKGLDLIVIRKSGNSLSLSKPCSHCSKFLKQKNVRNIIYSNENGSLVKKQAIEFESSHICSYQKQ